MIIEPIDLKQEEEELIEAERACEASESFKFSMEVARKLNEVINFINRYDVRQ